MTRWQPPKGLTLENRGRWAVLAFFAEAGDEGATADEVAEWMRLPEPVAMRHLLDWVACGAIRPTTLHRPDFDGDKPTRRWAVVPIGGDA